MVAGSPLTTPLSQLIDAFVGLVVVLAAVGIVYGFGRFIAVPVVGQLADAAEADETLRSTLVKVTGAAFALLGLYLAVPLSGLGTTPTTIAAITAGATIAIGFASREILANLVSGAILVVDPAFRIGDWIVWDGSEGVIEDIGFRVTRIHTFDNELITVPNSELTANAVTNPAAKARRRITFEFGIGYDDDIDEARAILREVANDHPDIVVRPAPRVLLVELADSAVGLQSQFWITDPDRADILQIRSEYAQAVKERFDEASIEMPYPYRELTGEVGTWTADGPDARASDDG